MKIIFLAIAAYICASYGPSTVVAQAEEDPDPRANLVIDAVIELLKKYAQTHDLEPMDIPDMNESFTVDILITSFDGKLTLKNGKLSHLVTLERSGNANLVNDGNLVHITTDVIFNDLVLDYDYDVSIMGLNPTGALEGIAQGLVLTVNITADLDSNTATLEGLLVKTAGDISISVDGNGLEDDIVNAISDLVEPFFENDILKFIEEKMQGTLADALVGFDIRQIIGGVKK